MNSHRCCVVAISILLGFGFGAWAPAQEKLSDAAKGLSLDHPESEQILVTEADGSQSGSMIDISGAEAVELAERALALGRTAESILAETRARDLFYDEHWRGRMLQAGSDLQNMRKSLDLVQPPDRYADPFEELLNGVRRYEMSAAMMRQAISDDEPLYSGAFDQFAAAGRTVLAGVVELRLEHEREGSEQPAPAIDSLTARQASASLCGSRYGDRGGSGYANCMAQQAAALDAVNRRFSFSVGLTEAAFNSIRNRCRGDFPDDMVARDRCELSRIDAATR